MGFFDLNIPYSESSPSDKSALRTIRMKLVIKAMEMGYTGIAYNRTMKGVMSDRDNCSIPFLSLSSLLKLAPSLSSSAQLHRDLLGVPRASPFRQYTRLTVCVDSSAQAQALNSGNPVLKTYDLVAVRPLNQTAFEQACERLEVDIIAIDFSEKLPFRLKLPMVKTAIGRGVYFEITYSNLIADVQTRRQMISNAKLLVDWTRGKNLIFSSCASSVNELRGPNDVSNLLSLFGLSMECARAAISKNCRTLVANALRKKRFYKEAIRVEVMPPGQQIDSNKPTSVDWLSWDPISSGEGDLLLDDLAKGFSASDKSSKTVKAINFTSVVNSMPSQGFHVKDFISGTQAVPQSPKDSNNIFSGADTIEVSVATEGVSEQSNQHTFQSETVHTSVSDPLSEQQTSGSGSFPTLSSAIASARVGSGKKAKTQASTEEELKTLNEVGVHFTSVETEMHDTESRKHVFSCEPNVVIPADNEVFCTSGMEIELDSAEVDSDTKDTKTQASTGEEPVTLNEADVNAVETEMLDVESQKPVVSCESNVMLPAENEVICASRVEIELEATKVELSTPYKENVGLVSLNKDLKGKNADALDAPMNDVETEMDVKCQANVSLHENISEREQLKDHGNDADIIANEGSRASAESYNEIKGNNDSQLPNQEVPEEVNIEEQQLGEYDDEINCSTPVRSLSGNSRAKQRIHRRALLFPFKRLLSPIHVPLKRKTQKIKTRNKRM